MLDLKEVKDYLKLEQLYDDEDELLNSLLKASEEYIENATGKKADAFGDSELYKLAQKMLITHMYDNRSPLINEGQKDLKYSLSGILTQLNYCYGG